MKHLIREIADWSEVWALLIPLAFMFRYKNRTPYLKPVRIYVWIALILMGIATLIWKRNSLHLPELPKWLQSNNFLYNAHSIVRLLLFGWFFILLNQPFMKRVKKIIPLVFTVLVIINFIFFENFFNYSLFSSRLLTTEAALLLFYCMQYYIFLLHEERATGLQKQPGFWVVTGLIFYVAVNFFIFLFYSYLVNLNLKFAIDIWDVHDVTYILLCICIAKDIYEQRKQ